MALRHDDSTINIVVVIIIISIIISIFLPSVDIFPREFKKLTQGVQSGYDNQSVGSTAGKLSRNIINYSPHHTADMLMRKL